MEETQPQLRRLQETLGRLAASADEQSSYLVRLGTAPSTDELALELDDLDGPLQILLEGGVVTPHAFEAVRRVRELLQAMSEDPPEGFWEVQSLASSFEWARIREQAAVALSCLGPSRDR